MAIENITPGETWSAIRTKINNNVNWLDTNKADSSDLLDYYAKSDFISFSQGTVHAGRPVVLDSEGRLDPSMVDVSIFNYVDEWTPSAGDEYPDTTGHDTGDFWQISGLSSTYTFTSGDLNGRSVDNGDSIIIAEAGWTIMAGQLNPNDYYQLNGSQAITADFAGGGYKISNIADGTASTDAATKGQLDVEIAAQYALDGSKAITADFDAGSHKLTKVASGTATDDAATKGQLDVEIAAQYALDGSKAITADFAGGNFQIKNIADGTDNTDAVTLSQLQSLNDVSDSTILNKIKNVDGSGSGLDADTLDGQELTDLDSRYVNTTGDTMTGSLTVSVNENAISLNKTAGYGSYIAFKTNNLMRWALDSTSISESGGNAGSDFTIYRYADDGSYLDNAFTIIRSSGAITFGTTNLSADGNTIWHSGNDGSGSGLDADTLDGQELTDLDSRYVNTTGDTMTGSLTVSTNGGTYILNKVAGNESYLSFKTDTNQRWIVNSNSTSESGGNAGSNFDINRYADNGSYLGNALRIIRSSGAVSFGSSDITAGGYTIWHSGNDGSGSGLDADTLDGYESSHFSTKAYADSINLGSSSCTVKAQYTTSDPDSLTTTGFYLVYNSNSPFHSASEDYFYLTVIQYSSSSQCQQIATPYHSGNNKIAVRRRHSGTWTDWDHMIDKRLDGQTLYLRWDGQDA